MIRIEKFPYSTFVNNLHFPGIKDTEMKHLKMKNRIYCGDCLEIMPRFKKESVDLILCDLPYGMTGNKWDSVIPMEDLWKCWKRILKPNGVVCLTSMGVFTAKVILSNEDWFKYKIVWDKGLPTGFLNSKKQPLRRHEDICVFYKSQPVYNPQMLEGDPYREISRAQSENYGTLKSILTISNGEKYPVDIIKVHNPNIKRKIHPTQKPVKLGNWFIKTFTNKGDLVFDATFGSGSFLVSAKSLQRKYCGIEKDKKYFKMTEKRLNSIGNKTLF